MTLLALTASFALAQGGPKIESLLAVAKPIASTQSWVPFWEETYDWASDHEIVYCLPSQKPEATYYDWRLRLLDLRTRRSRELANVTKVFQQTRDSATGFSISQRRNLLWGDSRGTIYTASLDGRNLLKRGAFLPKPNYGWSYDGRDILQFSSRKATGKVDVLLRHPFGTPKRRAIPLSSRVQQMFEDGTAGNLRNFVETKNGRLLLSASPNGDSDLTGPTDTLYFHELGGAGALDLVGTRSMPIPKEWQRAEVFYRPGGAEAILVFRSGRLDRNEFDTDAAFEMAQDNSPVKARLGLVKLSDLNVKWLGELSTKKWKLDPVSTIRWIPGKRAVSFLWDGKLYRLELDRAPPKTAQSLL